jgi:hypothetical protein
MAFDLELTFTGIAAFIPNPYYSDGAEDEVPFYVIMPGVEGAKDALDDEPLCPHNSYIEPGVMGPARTSLKGTIVSFDLDYGGETPNYQATALPKELINLGTLLDKLCVVDFDVLEPDSPPRPASVMTQILLPEGDFDKNLDLGCWCIDPLGQGNGITGQIAHVVSIKWTSLEKARMIIADMDGTDEIEKCWSQENGVISLSFVNTCKETPDLLKPYKARRDRDFKWYYELLTKPARDEIVALLENQDLPIPRYCTESTGKGALARALKERLELEFLVLSHDCFPGQMASYANGAAQARTPRRRGKAER